MASAPGQVSVVNGGAAPRANNVYQYSQNNNNNIVGNSLAAILSDAGAVNMNMGENGGWGVKKRENSGK